MLVVDTEVLFAFNPNDPKYQRTLSFLKEHTDVLVPDTAVFEFQIVLRGRGRNPSQVKTALLALREALIRNNVMEVKTIDGSLLMMQCELEEHYGLSYFDSLVAASTLVLGGQLVSDDEAFDRIPDIRRVPLSQ